MTFEPSVCGSACPALSFAGLAGVSLSSLAGIEQGACPAHSRVLDQAWVALARVATEQEARVAA